MQILVVKSGYLSPELAPLANPNLMALSEGVVDQDIERVPRRRMLTPTWPFTGTLEFTPRAFVSARAPFAGEC
ncbi:MlrC C-terminus [Raoultella terrigena]|uniref:MlrC C-terminus n=1 Tax=Raoultella terrigena TaxID=577 RepID=A0A4U9CXR8_RAOTE|nr:MlrC C-terminus [Raoultella terrigena]